MRGQKKPARKKRAQKKGGRSRSQLLAGLSQLAPGMPSLDSVTEVVNFVSPQNVKYKILKTTEMNEYDPVATPPKKLSKRKPESR